MKIRISKCKCTHNILHLWQNKIFHLQYIQFLLKHPFVYKIVKIHDQDLSINIHVMLIKLNVVIKNSKLFFFGKINVQRALWYLLACNKIGQWRLKYKIITSKLVNITQWYLQLFNHFFKNKFINACFLSIFFLVLSSRFLWTNCQLCIFTVLFKMFWSCPCINHNCRVLLYPYMYKLLMDIKSFFLFILLISFFIYTAFMCFHSFKMAFSTVLF